MKKRIYTIEQARERHNEQAKAYQKKLWKKKRAEKLYGLVLAVEMLQEAGLTTMQIAEELEHQGYKGTKSKGEQ